MKKAKWIILAVTILMALAALWLISNVSSQIRTSEQEKVKLWAAAISQKAQLVSSTEQFFLEVEQEEHSRMQLLSEAQQEFVKQPLGREVGFCYNYIASNKTIPVIITDLDSNITSFNNIELPEGTTRLEGPLMEEFSQKEPIPYSFWGMHFMLYYKESKIYTDLRNVLNGLNESFLSEITNNSVFVPVIVVDSLQGEVIGYGNIKERDFSTDEKLFDKLCEMQEENDPIEIRLPDHQRAYIFYESTPLLKMLRWVPILYIFITLVLVVISYNLFRTAHTMEQNRIWVGMAKETAHQLGTPISSLLAWTEYLQGKTLDEKYATEIRKDLSRLETITHRFSKIGSVPELTDDSVTDTVTQVVNYLQSRSPRKVHFVTSLPEQDLRAPINRYLFEWVIENICKNAIDAMSGNGTITIIGSSDTHHIYLDISDTGKGIPASQQKKIFESGFTTKQRGWGLGLSLAKRIIEEYHRGKIYLKYSVVGQGSVFRIVLNRES